MILVFLYVCYIGCPVKKLIPKFYRTPIILNIILKKNTNYAVLAGLRSSRTNEHDVSDATTIPEAVNARNILTSNSLIRNHCCLVIRL